MFASLRGAFPRPFRGLRKPLLAVSLAALLAACSSNRPPPGPQVFSWLAEPAPPPAAAPVSVELEDDGLPPQSPPPRSIRAQPDDPNEPWSPNYGRTVDATGRAAGSDSSWAAIADDAGLPRPMSPEEAGLRLAPEARRERGAALSPPAVIFRDRSRPWRGAR